MHTNQNNQLQVISNSDGIRVLLNGHEICTRLHSGGEIQEVDPIELLRALGRAFNVPDKEIEECYDQLVKRQQEIINKYA